MIIPIVLQHHNEPLFLLRAVEAIAQRTKIPYLLFVVDNASPITSEVSRVLYAVSHQYSAIVIHNPKNNWVFGFNLAITHPSWPNSELCAFSDADIIVPALDGDGTCWLSYLVEQMENHHCIGKLGLSLDLTNLAENPKLVHTYKIEQKYLQGKRIGPNIIAPVDTTMALYRRGLFVNGFRFSIGHASLVKPYYYTCRTRPEISAVHLGWDFYPGAGEQTYDDDMLWKKSFAMCRFGAHVDPSILDRFSFGKRVFLRVTQFTARCFFGIRVVLLMLAYLVRRFPRKINEIQASCR